MSVKAFNLTYYALQLLNAMTFLATLVVTSDPNVLDTMALSLR